MEHHLYTGNVCKDAVLKTVGDKSVCNFTLANNKFKGEAQFIQCSLWGKRAENAAQYLTKGKKITVSGNDLKWRIVEGKNGATVVADLMVDAFDFGGASKSAEPEEHHDAQNGFTVVTEDNDLPF